MTKDEDDEQHGT